MRQAGRHLKEYKQLRKSQPDFLKFCLTPKLCLKATMQPMARYDLDAAIIFSDILLVHYGLGYQVSYDGGYPRISGNGGEFVEAKVAAVGEAVELVRNELDRQKALIGFSGAPWTLLVYAVSKKPRPPFAELRKLFNDEKTAEILLDKFTAAAGDYLALQLKAGVNAVMLFDSWAGVIPNDKLAKYVFAPHKKIVRRLRRSFPEVAVIGFPHGIDRRKLAEYAAATEVDAVSVDDGTDPTYAAAELGKISAVQGNLSPLLLKLGGERLEKGVAKIQRAFAATPHIFNLGHGILPTTDPKNVEKLIALVKN